MKEYTIRLQRISKFDVDFRYDLNERMQAQGVNAPGVGGVTNVGRVGQLLTRIRIKALSFLNNVCLIRLPFPPDADLFQAGQCL